MLKSIQFMFNEKNVSKNAKYLKKYTAKVPKVIAKISRRS